MKFQGLRDVFPLAQGGQKIVYRAKHMTLGEVALKLVVGAIADERTAREIEAATKYSFPNVPTLYEWGIFSQDADEQITYLLEQFIHGKTLQRVLTEMGTLGIPKTLELIKTLLTIEVELEKQQIVHRDIKPQNIMLDAFGKFWLLDFGIARHLRKSSITATGAHFGPHTAGYAAPEQFRNYKRDIDIRADLFSIGVVAYEALSGVNPFRAGAQSGLDILSRAETMMPSPLVIPGDSQRQLSGLVGIMMEKFPSRRPMTAQIALDWFEAALPTIKP